MIGMQDIRVSSWKFVAVEVLVIAVVILATYTLSSPDHNNTTTTTALSTTYPSTATTTINQSKTVPYLTLADMQMFFGKRSGAAYNSYYCNPSNSTNPNICAGVSFFGQKGQFAGWIIQYKAQGLSLNEMLMLNDRNSSYVYGSLAKAAYPNDTISYYPSNIVINATENGSIYSAQIYDTYTNIYMLKGGSAAFVYISGVNYSQDYTPMIVATLSGRI